jgi:hypothetical protein
MGNICPKKLQHYEPLLAYPFLFCKLFHFNKQFKQCIQGILRFQKWFGVNVLDFLIEL